MILKSKDINDYFSAQLVDIRPGALLPFDIYLYFPKNNHIILWCRKNDTPNIALVASAKARGLEHIWIHKDDLFVYPAYMAGPLATKTAPRTKQGEAMATILNSPAINEEEKRALLADNAKELLKTAGSADTTAKQNEINLITHLTIQDVLQAASKEVQTAVASLWKLSEQDADLQHATNVAAYAVLFAIAAGKIQPEMIANIALTGLLHDIGLSQLPVEVVSCPRIFMDQQAFETFQRHPDHGIKLLNQYYPNLPEKVKSAIELQNQRIHQPPEGEVEEICQLIAMAELLAWFSSGQWDGKQRTLTETCETLANLQQQNRAPERFSPDIFKEILRWITGFSEEALTKVISGTASIVKIKAHEVIA